MISGDRSTAALLTPSGTGAIAVIRVVGSAPMRTLQPVLRLRRQTAKDERADDSLLLADFADGTGGEIIDEIIVSPFQLSGHHAVDLCLHGSMRIVERVLTALENLGIQVVGKREAATWPHSGGIVEDVTTALQVAKTQRAVRFLAWQRSHLTSYLSDVARLTVEHTIAARGALQKLIDRGRCGIVLVEGATVVLIGPPNSGKSTLFNHLVGRPASVVSARAGTTRDWVTADVDFEGVPVRLVDTAGRRTDADALEQTAVATGIAQVESADVILLVLDGSTKLTGESDELLEWVKSRENSVVIWNKADICQKKAVEREVPVSALTGMGVREIVRLVLNRIGLSDWEDKEPAFFTRRQIDWGTRTLAALSLNDAAMGRRMLQEFVKMEVDFIKLGGLQ